MHSFLFSVPLAARSLLCAFSCIVLTASCAYSPSTTLPETDTQALQKAKSVDATSQITTSWWKVFEVAELAPVMKSLESQNLTLNQAEQRVKRAQFLLAQVNAGDVPTLIGRASGRSGRDLDSGRSSHSTSGGLGLNYDADIWGTRDAQQRSRQLGIDTAQYQFTDALLDTQ
ncbi:MAG: TolC family protein, partial [Pseudomonadota bacterium]|nr:TolC family protein [Pseudomonadota bacterium]